MDPTKPIKPTQAQVKRSIVDWCNHNGGFATETLKSYARIRIWLEWAMC